MAESAVRGRQGTSCGEATGEVEEALGQGAGGLASRLPPGPGRRARAEVSAFDAAPYTEDPAVPAGVAAGPRGALGDSGAWRQIQEGVGAGVAIRSPTSLRSCLRSTFV